MPVPAFAVARTTPVPDVIVTRRLVPVPFMFYFIFVWFAFTFFFFSASHFLHFLHFLHFFSFFGSGGFPSRGQFNSDAHGSEFRVID